MRTACPTPKIEHRMDDLYRTRWAAATPAGHRTRQQSEHRSPGAVFLGQRGGETLRTMRAPIGSLVIEHAGVRMLGRQWQRRHSAPHLRYVY